MAKYLYFQDGHCGGKNPEYRKGEFFNDWLKKFDEILSLAKKHKVEAIIDGGDLVHSPEPSYKILDEIADRVELNGIPVYSLFGNHAELYHSMEHSKYTGLAHLQKRSKVFKYFDEIVGKDFYIKGIEYSHNVEEEIKSKGIELRVESTGMWNIAVVHAFICPKEFPYASHVVCDDIKTNADLVLVAHYHSVWEKKVGDTQYVDIGCLGRRSITEAEIKPSVILLDTDKRSYEVIPLKKVKPAAEAFDLERKVEVKAFDANIEKFIESIKDIYVQSMDLEQLIIVMGKENNVEQDVIEILLDRIKDIKIRESNNV